MKVTDEGLAPKSIHNYIRTVRAFYSDPRIRAPTAGPAQRLPARPDMMLENAR